ncbi:class I SAM-dependent methyltransferase [Patescibacteria group bacterium]|nr:class I SAM-dependent methyltransferase [Patescibacteria group bacterium]
MDLTSFGKNWRESFSSLAQKEKEDYKLTQTWSREGEENYKKYFFAYFGPHTQGEHSRISVLDVGCGPGIYVSELAKEGFQVQGVDYSEEVIAVAKKRIPKNSAQLSVADVYNLPFSDNSFDVVICLGLFQSVDDYERGLREIERVLKKDGLLIVTTLNSFSLFSLLFRGKTGSAVSWRRYSPYSFQGKLSRLGFTQLKLKGIYFVPQPLHFVSRLILQLRIYKLFNLLFPLFLLFSNSFYIEGKKKRGDRAK